MRTIKQPDVVWRIIIGWSYLEHIRVFKASPDFEKQTGLSPLALTAQSSFQTKN